MDKMKAAAGGVEKKGGHFKMMAAHDIHLLRWQGRRSIVRRLFTLLIGLALLILVVTFYHTLIPSYMDLMDDIMDSETVLDSDTAILPSSSSSTSEAGTALPCQDGSGWVEEWIASGVMPKCSLAQRSTIDILYTYILTLLFLFGRDVLTVVDGSMVQKHSISMKRRIGRTDHPFSAGPEKRTIGKSQ